MPGDSYNFIWFNFYVDGAWFKDGNEYGGNFHIALPEGATWKSRGYIDNVVEGVWRAGESQITPIFTYATIDHTMVNWPSEPVPIPDASILFLSGLSFIGLLRFGRKSKN